MTLWTESTEVESSEIVELEKFKIHNFFLIRIEKCCYK